MIEKIIRFSGDIVGDLVRCKKCKYRPDEDGDVGTWCYKLGRDTDDDDFCSYGEAKEGE